MALAGVTIHSSQFPENVRRDLLQSLRARAINQKFHYDSHKQARKWLALHEAFSPARTDPGCLAIYDESFIAVGKELAKREVRVVGLGCGGGQKDVRLLRLLADGGALVSYQPCDVSLPLVLAAREAAGAAIRGICCEPLIFDLATLADPRELFPRTGKTGAIRLFTFFGMIPNFEPELILPLLSGLLNQGELLLFSANLAPGDDYTAGMQRILPGYDNALTRDWLTTFLFDIGFEPGDGNMRFVIENTAAGYKRVAAYFDVVKDRAVSIDTDSFVFRAQESIRLFFSYRYTPGHIRSLLQRHKLQIRGQWISSSGEEGVFFCQKE